MAVIDKTTLVSCMSEIFNVCLTPVSTKKIFFEAIDDNGQSFLLCTPNSRFHDSIDAWWIDITQVQYDLLEQYSKSVLVFRLEGKKVCVVSWNDLKPYLTKSCMKYNKSEQDHWKIYIYDNHLKVVGNDNTLAISIKG